MKFVLFSKILTTALFTLMNTVPNVAGIILFKRSSSNCASNINIKRISQLLFPLKSTKNRRFFYDFRGNRSQLIWSNALNLRRATWRRSVNLLNHSVLKNYTDHKIKKHCVYTRNLLNAQVRRVFCKFLSSNLIKRD